MCLSYMYINHTKLQRYADNRSIRSKWDLWKMLGQTALSFVLTFQKNSWLVSDNFSCWFARGCLEDLELEIALSITNIHNRSFFTYLTFFIQNSSQFSKTKYSSHCCTSKWDHYFVTQVTITSNKNVLATAAAKRMFLNAAYSSLIFKLLTCIWADMSNHLLPKYWLRLNARANQNWRVTNTAPSGLSDDYCYCTPRRMILKRRNKERKRGSSFHWLLFYWALWAPTPGLLLLQKNGWLSFIRTPSYMGDPPPFWRVWNFFDPPPNFFSLPPPSGRSIPM